MAGRNRKNSAEYFSHDVDASSDEKLVYLESLFGHAGYAIYFKFLEKMARSDGFEIDWNDIKKAIYASEFHISVAEIEQIISECCRQEIKAFEIDNGKMFSPGLKKRMQPMLDKREYNRKKYESTKANQTSKLKKSVTEKVNSADELTQSKVKESKVKDINKEKKKTFSSFQLKKLLCEKIQENSMGEFQDKIQEFFGYRQTKPIKNQYQSEKGINGLFRNLIGCRDAGLNIPDCLEIAMEENWLTPKPQYFENRTGGKKNGKPQHNYTGQDTRPSIIPPRDFIV